MAKLIFMYGSMNASKSANLIMQAFTHDANGKPYIAFKPAKDDRDGAVIHSRALQTTIPATVVTADDISKMFVATVNAKPRIVFVDEVQFMTVEQIDELASIVDVLGVTVQAYGLLTDFTGKMFDASKRLAELADVVERVRSECTQCNNEGIINARFINGEIQLHGEQIVTGKEDKYKVLCRRCFTELGGV